MSTARVKTSKHARRDGRYCGQLRARWPDIGSTCAHSQDPRSKFLLDLSYRRRMEEACDDGIAFWPWLLIAFSLLPAAKPSCLKVVLFNLCFFEELIHTELVTDKCVEYLIQTPRKVRGPPRGGCRRACATRRGDLGGIHI